MEKNQEDTNTMVLEKGKTITINGTVITPDIIDGIRFFQDDENELLIKFREYISDAICGLLQSIDNTRCLEREETIRTVTDLSYCRDYLNRLKKPIE